MDKLVEKIAERLLTQKEILEAPHPTITRRVNHDERVVELVNVNMDGILALQDAKTTKAILSDPNIIEQTRKEVLDEIKKYHVGYARNGHITATKSGTWQGFVFVIPDEKYRELFKEG